MPLTLLSQKMIGQTRVKKQLATQSVFYGGIESVDMQQSKDRRAFRKQSGSTSIMMHNPSEVSLGKGSLRMGQTTVNNSKVSLLRRTRQSTRQSHESIGNHRPNSSIEDIPNDNMMNTIMNIETNNQSISTDMRGNLLKNKKQFQSLRNSSALRLGSKGSMKSGAGTILASTTNQIFIQSNDYQQSKPAKVTQPRRSRPMTSMTKHTKNLSSSMGCPYRPLTGQNMGGSPPSSKNVSNTRTISGTMTEAQIKSTVTNLQTMLSKLPSNTKSNKNYFGKSGNQSLSQNFQLYIPRQPDLSTVGTTKDVVNAERNAILQKEKAKKMLLEMHTKRVAIR